MRIVAVAFALAATVTGALRHLDFFPVEINRTDYETLLRVPGIGAKTAHRVIETRRSRKISFDGLRRLGAGLQLPLFEF